MRCRLGSRGLRRRRNGCFYDSSGLEAKLPSIMGNGISWWAPHSYGISLVRAAQTAPIAPTLTASAFSILLMRVMGASPLLNMRVASETIGRAAVATQTAQKR